MLRPRHQQPVATAATKPDAPSREYTLDLNTGRNRLVMDCACASKAVADCIGNNAITERVTPTDFCISINSILAMGQANTQTIFN